MKARITKIGNEQNYSAVTENRIAISFSLLYAAELLLSDEIEVDLENIVDSKKIWLPKIQRELDIQIRADDLHDLDLPSGHGTRRTPSRERMKK